MNILCWKIYFFKYISVTERVFFQYEFDYKTKNDTLKVFTYYYVINLKKDKRLEKTFFSSSLFWQKI